jgi:hypothetical protein
MSQTVVESLVSQQVYSTTAADSFEVVFKAEFISFIEIYATRVNFMYSGQLDFYKGKELVASIPEKLVESLFGFETVDGQKVQKFCLVF